MKAYEFEPGEQVVVYADGSSRDNGKPHARGGWGFVILDKSETWKRFENWGAEHGATNNQMELRAAIEALEALPKGTYIHMKLDSKYVMDGATSWIKGWVRNGWKTAAKKPVANADLWQRLVAEAARHDIEWLWVKGHAGHGDNELADRLASDAALEVARAR